MTVLRIYLPSECDASGELLDWERCRTCEGEGWASRPLGLPRDKHTATQTCPTCDGHGSLRAAALAALAHNHPGEPFSTQGYALDGMVVRCEDCGHPAGDGSWEWRSADAERRFGALTPVPEKNMGVALEALREGCEPGLPEIYYSPCDEGCRHGGPGRASQGDLRDQPVGAWLVKAAEYGVKPMVSYEASWRPVDVRCLSWPHDLRPESLAVLCLRCWAARK